MTRRQDLLLGLELALAALVAAAVVGLAYLTSPAVALAAPAALATAVVIFARPMVGVYLALLAIPLELFQIRVAAAGLSAAEALLLVTAAAALARRLPATMRETAPLHPAQLAMAGLLVVVAVGFQVALEPTGVRDVLVLWTSFLVVSVLVASAQDGQIERALLCMVIAGGVVGIVALATTSDPTLRLGGQDVLNRAEGTFSHPNQLAFVLVLTIPLALALVARGPTWQRVVAFIAVAAAIPALLQTFSRSGIIGLTVSVMVLMAWTGFRRVAIGLLAGVIAFSLVNLEAIARNKEVTLLTRRLQTVTDASARNRNPRITIYRKTGRIIADHPFLGVGQRNFEEVSPQYGLRDEEGGSYVHAHNILLTIAAETGLIGLALFIAFLVMVARAARQALARRRDAYPVVIALVAALCGLLATSMTEYPIGINIVMAIVLIQVGALVHYARSSPTRPASGLLPAKSAGAGPAPPGSDLGRRAPATV